MIIDTLKLLWRRLIYRDHTAIVQAMLDAQTVGDGIVTLTPGEYNLFRTLRIPDSSTEILCAGVVLNWYGGSLPVIHREADGECRFYDLTIDGGLTAHGAIYSEIAGDDE
jgi:hypothetical protein